MTIAPAKTEHTFTFNIEHVAEYSYNPSLIAFDEYAAFNVSPSEEVGYIQNIIPIFLTYIEHIEIDTNNESAVRFQISNDGHKWYFFNDITRRWERVTGSTNISNESCSMSGFIDNIHDFAWEVGDGGIQIKSYLMEPGTDITRMYIKYKKHYANIQDVKRSMNQFALMRMNTITQLPENFINYELVKERMADADFYIDSETQRDFLYHEFQREWHDGNSTNKLILRFFPILNLHYLVMYNQMLQAMRTFLDSEIIFGQGGEWGEIFLPPIYPAYLTDHPVKSLFGNVFITGNRNIEVFYDWGYKQTPGDVQLASKKMMIIYLLNDYLAYLSRGGNSRSIDGYSESYAAKGPFSAIIDQYQKEVDKILSRRKRYYSRFV
jgi:hypothetical protein